jgi:putative DNA primase/helicase
MSLQDPYAPLSADEEAEAPKAPKATDKVPIVPVPDDAPACNFKIPGRGGEPKMKWAYLAADGKLLGYDARFEFEENGKPQKEVRPVTFCQVGDKRAWRSKAFPAPRPLYGLDRLAARPDAPVIVVEGCRCADAAEKLLPAYVAVTWPGGSEAAGMTDWAPLAGRDVTIWPDRDRQRDKAGTEKPYDKQPGTIAALTVASRLQGVAASIAALDLAQLDVNGGWDAADALEEGWSSDKAEQFVADHRKSAERPIIYLDAGKLHINASEAEDALIAAGAQFYVRGGIVRPVVDDVQASHGRTTKVARLVTVEADSLVDHLSRHAAWKKFNARANAYIPADPPRAVAVAVLTRDGEWKLPQLAGVITTQTLRPDGSLLAEPGYDPQTRLLLMKPPALPPIPAAPTKEQAADALATLDALLDGFPFIDGASRSVALSALLTTVSRGAMAVAPLHAMSAPVAGSGKSYLVDIASAIQTGERAPVIAAGRTEEETEKRLSAALLGGQSIITIDNVNGELGGDALCQMIERPVVSVRPLGQSKLVKLESRATMFATGNNIHLVGDMTRRVILCSLDPEMERPELRVFNSNPFDAVVADRGRYVGAALTVVRAYIAAGCPGALPALASFESWSKYVRSALVWLGRADPCSTTETARDDDPVSTSLRVLFNAWHRAIGEDPVTTGKAKQTADTLDPLGNLVSPELREALMAVAEARAGGIDAKKLGHFLSRHCRRVLDGLKLTSLEDSHSKQKLWRVSRVDGADKS